MIDHSDILSASQRYALGVEYDGSQFHGWQMQSGVSTVQESLERALGRVASHPVRLTYGRADRHGRARVGTGRSFRQSFRPAS